MYSKQALTAQVISRVTMPMDFLALHTPKGRKAMQKLGISTLDELFLVIHETMRSDQTLPHQIFAVAPRHALFKGQLFHFMYVNLPGVGFLLKDAIKANRIMVGGKRKGNREWISLIPCSRERLSAPLTTPFSENEVTCPITMEAIGDPVVAADGHTYEREAIEMWLKKNLTSPMTGARLTSFLLYPNHILKCLN